MLYSPDDIARIQKQIWRRIAVLAVLFILPNIGAFAVMTTVRIQWLSVALSLLGAAAAIFYWGLCISPLMAYKRFLREVLTGRNHEFTGELKAVEQDSVREGVLCKALVFADDAGDEERLCYFDVQKYPKDGLNCGERFKITVHGQSILELVPESAE